MALGDLHETGVHPLREARMRFDQRPWIATGAVDVIDDLHGVRVAHRDSGDGDGRSRRRSSG